MTTERKNPLGPTGETARQNVKRIREELDLSYAEVSRRLDAAGRPIATLGLSRIEAGNRRIDVDDLLALAIALDVSPATLLMPPAEDASAEVEATAIGAVAARQLWSWLTGSGTGRPGATVIDLDWTIRARPTWSTEEQFDDTTDARILEHAREIIRITKGRFGGNL